MTGPAPTPPYDRPEGPAEVDVLTTAVIGRPRAEVAATAVPAPPG